jgi:2-oxoglutarate dehydrogenase E1 component
MWEAQFGDFANGAQVIIDQFLSSAESKWQRVSGLVLLLPHGYEGQGPEHSSARLERFLQLCAEENIQVCNLTTPAQYFHLLRRQLHRPFKKPLVLMTPKSLLRHPKCVSTADDFLNGRFHEAMDSPLLGPPEKIKRVIFCSGKVYYDLLEFREAEHIATAAIVRIEQLYPFHSAGVREIVRQFPNVDRYVWCQEEPQNMGAWGFIAPLLRDLWAEEHELNPRRIEVRYAGRDAGASPAVGATTVHKKEQAALIKEAFTVGTPLSKPVIPNE